MPIAASDARVNTAAARNPIMSSSGARLRILLEATGFSIPAFAGYWAGFPVGKQIDREERSERGRRYRAHRRALYRWHGDEVTITDDYAREIVKVANRLLRKRGQETFPADYLVTHEAARLAGLEELGRKLDDVIARLDDLEARLK